MKERFLRIQRAMLIFTTLSLLCPASGRTVDDCEEDCHAGVPAVYYYYAVLDLVFPRVRFEDPYLVLRYLPAGEPERQIILAAKAADSYEIIYYSLPKGSERISSQLRQLRASHPDDTPVQMAKRIKVEQRILHINPKEIAALVSSFKKLRIPAELDTRMIVHGSDYDFWFISFPACHILHLSVSDADYGRDSKAHPLVRWMNRVRRAVESADEQGLQK